MATRPDLTITPVTPDDAGDLHQMIAELAIYERLEGRCSSTAEGLKKELESENPALEGLIARIEGEPVGMATFFQTYSTFQGQRGIYLEDLYVKEHLRHQGIGYAILQRIGQMALERDYARIEWTTLLWNSQAIEFYESIGAKPNDAWTIYRLSGEWLKRLALPR